MTLKNDDKFEEELTCRFMVLKSDAKFVKKVTCGLIRGI